MEFTPLMRGDSSGMRGESSAPDPLPHSLPSMDEDGLMGRGRGVPPPPLDEPSRRRPGASFPRPRPKLMGSGTGPTLVQGSPGQMGGVPGRPDAAAGIGQPGQPPGSGAPGSDSVRLLALIRRKLRDTEVRLQLESQIKNGLEDTVTNLLRENEKLRKDNGELKQRHMDLKVEQLEWTEWKMREKKRLSWSEQVEVYRDGFFEGMHACWQAMLQSHRETKEVVAAILLLIVLFIVFLTFFWDAIRT
eukprot:Rmarinus@m.9643